MLNVNDDWDLQGAVGVDEVAAGAVMRHRQQLQESRRAKKPSVPANVSEVFMLATELVAEQAAGVPVAMKSDATKARVIMADALKRAHEEAKNAKIELVRITKAQEEMRELIPRMFMSCVRGD